MSVVLLSSEKAYLCLAVTAFQSPPPIDCTRLKSSRKAEVSKALNPLSRKAALRRQDLVGSRGSCSEAGFVHGYTSISCDEEVDKKSVERWPLMGRLYYVVETCNGDVNVKYS